MKFKYLHLFIILTVTFSYSQNSKSSTYHTNGNEYKLSTKSWQTKTAYDYGLNMAFSVYKNNKFVHPADVADGRYVGCRYAFDGAGSTYTIEHLTGFGGQKIGWIINGMFNSCGASYSSKKQIFIIPFKDTYYSFAIDLPEEIESFITDTSKDTLSIWYHCYQWGDWGNYLNYLVPVKIDIIKDQYSIRIEKGNLMNGKGKMRWNFVSLFNASIRDKNAELLQFALDNFFDPKESETYIRYKVPANKKEIEKIIQTIKDYNITQEKFDKVFDKFTFISIEKPHLYNK